MKIPAAQAGSTGDRHFTFSIEYLGDPSTTLASGG